MIIFTIIKNKHHMRKYFPIFCLIFLFNTEVSAQNEPEHKKNLFSFYKKFISSQDGPVCNFSPSCSEFAKLSIKKHGLILGVFYTADRLCRCHPYNLYQYKLNTKLNRSIDQP